MLLLFWLFFHPSDSAALADIASLFRNGDSAGFIALLERSERVRCDLRPLLPVRGNLAKAQVAESFRLWSSLYKVERVEVWNPQSDTNYAWLEFQLRLEVVERVSKRPYSLLMVLHFKAAKNRLALDQWLLQDLR